MLKLSRVKTLEFDYRDMDLGIFFTCRVPFTMERYEAVLQLAGSCNIKLIP